MNEAKAPSCGSVMPVIGRGLAFLESFCRGLFYSNTLIGKRQKV